MSVLRKIKNFIISALTELFNGLWQAQKLDKLVTEKLMLLATKQQHNLSIDNTRAINMVPCDIKLW